MTRHVDHIVVGLDDTEGGRAALLFALHDAVRRGAHVDVVAAFRIPEYRAAINETPVGWQTPERPTAERTAAVRELATAIVDEARAELASGALVPPPVTVLAVGGSAGEVLVHAAHNADLLVVGSRGRGRVAGAVLGSVSLYCVLHARCPVTVVQPAADRSPAPVAG